jgi:hypothetical protein
MAVKSSKQPAGRKKKTGPIPVGQNKFDAVGEDEIIAMIRDGMMLTEIARNVGVDRRVFTAWIEQNPSRSARAREARSLAAAMYDEMALEELRNAADPFELAKSREIASHLRWKASKLNPKMYGDKVSAEVSGVDGAPIKIDATLSPDEAYLKLLGK